MHSFLKNKAQFGWRIALILLAVLVPAFVRLTATDLLCVEGSTITTRVAQKNGFYAKYGIEVHSTNSPNSETMRNRLAHGDVDVMEDGLDNAVAMNIAGEDIVIVTGSSLADQQLFAQPGIASVKDLRGKTLIVDALNTQAALILKKIMLNGGLKLGVDYQLTEIGTQRLPQMRANKNYAAAMMWGTTALLAKSEGFVRVGESTKAIGPILYHGAYVRRDWAREHTALLSRYIAAEIEAQRWVMDPANHDKVTQLTMETSNPKVSLEIAGQAVTEMVSGEGGLTKEMEFNAPAFENFLKLRAEIEGSWGGKPPAASKFYDLSYYREAKKLIAKAEKR